MNTVYNWYNQDGIIIHLYPFANILIVILDIKMYLKYVDTSLCIIKPELIILLNWDKGFYFDTVYLLTITHTHTHLCSFLIAYTL